MERAVVHGDVHDDDSPRAQSLSMAIGTVAAALALAVGGVLAVWRPSAEVGAAAVLAVRGSGALYVRVDDVVHPVLNLASAKLIAATDQPPREVTEAAIADTERGALLGIPGAPSLIGPVLSEAESGWSVCDDEMTTVIAGPLAPTVRRTDPDQAILVVGPSGTTYLLYSGRRARVDLTDPVVSAVLGAETVAPARVSRALLELLPEVSPLTAPDIPGLGAPGPAALPGFLIGEIVQVRQATGSEFLVVLAGGVQRVGRLAADLLRHSGPSATVTAVAPAAVAQLPRLGVLAVQTFPEQIGSIGGADIGVVCASWTPGSTELRVGGPALSAAPAALAQADGSGPLTDAVSLPGGRSAYVHAQGTRTVTGALITEQGVRFRVGDEESARLLGLPGAALPVPRAVLEALPEGPALSRSAALTAYDVVGSP